MSPGKYRYRITIESYNAITNTWGTYTSAFAQIDISNSGTVINPGDGAIQSTRQYQIRFPYQSTKTITTKMRVSWTVHGSARLMYITGIEEDPSTMNMETVLSCDEVSE
jgi:head-tail adaptor